MSGTLNYSIWKIFLKQLPTTVNLFRSMEREKMQHGVNRLLCIFKLDIENDMVSRAECVDCMRYLMFGGVKFLIYYFAEFSWRWDLWALCTSDQNSFQKRRKKKQNRLFSPLDEAWNIFGYKVEISFHTKKISLLEKILSF